MLENRLSVLAMTNAGQDLIAGIQNFNENVMDEFASRKEGRTCFVFKLIEL